MSENKYLKPMLDTGSPRVFNCNEMSRRVFAQNPEATPFFHNKAMNSIVLIKDTVPTNERQVGEPSVATKLYFPFNENNIYEGGRTIFFHAKGIEGAISDYCGESALTQTALAHDMTVLRLLQRLPSLDPFLMKDAFLREKLVADPAYFEVSEEAWSEIELFMLQKFETLIFAAFPDAKSSEEKARQLIDKIWEAKDIDALLPLIEAFRLPKDRALEIFSAWKGIVYYSFQYNKEQGRFIELVKWIVENSAPRTGVPAAETKDVQTCMTQAREQLRIEWQKTDEIVKAYQSSYDKMFKDRTGSSDFLAFLQNSDKTYWEIGSSLGKINHAIYCWDVMSSRYDGRKVPWACCQDIAHLLAKVLEIGRASCRERV